MLLTRVYVHTKSQDLKSLQAGSWYPCFVLLMVLFRFYYSEYLTHLCSQRRLYPARRLLWNATRYSFPFSNPILPLLSATATVSNCFLLSYFSFFPPPLLTLSSVVHFPTADKWSSLMNTKEYSEASHPAQKGKKQMMFFNEESFFLIKHKRQ